MGFVEVSLLAYPCVIYARWKVLKKCDTDPDEFIFRIVCGKARVTPAPRSEISGFLILTRLLKVGIDAMEYKPSLVNLAVDSQCSISALQKSGGLLAPYFASRVSESVSNLPHLLDDILVDPIQRVPGPMNPADIPPDDVRHGSVWQDGPNYLRLPQEAWPFSRKFLDEDPDQEMRAPKALLNSIIVKGWKC